ncbi:uncharacterized protein LOC131002283 [Salvia miltiorrhiza]|uniref:uncharacterized protein LOC131002283 n=1 Tax=Salvia miltiorrhiza TaxID=226208 RepID=UPI0025AC4D3F|nr:uncharacterized protein LOC131002283 [Salvia miltiorrhiza]
MNWKKANKGITLKNMFWKAARSTNEEEFKISVQELKQENSAAYDDFMSRDFHKFCKAFLSTNAFSDMIDNNISETFNGYILNARGKHVIHMCEEIRTSLMVRQVKKYKEMSVVDDRICPAVRKQLEKRREYSANCHTFPALGGKFEVHIEAGNFVVNLGGRSCTCRVWDLTGIPCIHAISAVHFMNLDPADFVHDFYTVRKYLQAYEVGLEPVRGANMWPEVVGSIVKPPEVRKMPGRPKKKRRRDPEEKNTHKLSKHGVRMTCGKCHQEGHNIRGCKNEIVHKPPQEKRRRGRPSKKPSNISQEARATTTSSSRGQSTIVNEISRTQESRS